MLSSPRTTPGFTEGLEALAFFGCSFLGLRISLFDFWPLAMTGSSTGQNALGRKDTTPAAATSHEFGGPMLHCGTLGRWGASAPRKELLMTPSPSPSPALLRQWTKLWVDASFLMADATTVMMLRSLRMMGGGRTAGREAERMMGEKVEAGFELAGALASGRVRSPEAAARKAMTVAGKRVRANRKRLA